MKTRTSCTRRSYAVEVTVKQFTLIEQRDDKCKGLSDFGLLSILENMGCHSIEYNGHFGATIFYTLDTETDTDTLREQIERTIINYANGRHVASI
ncbi:hypothetical protein D3C75_597010 [compost metagenome]